MRSFRFKNGFTLVETLVAVSILLLAVIGPMTIAQKGLQNAVLANEQTTAVFLAQEAVEAVRSVRDYQAISTFKNGGVSNSWINSLSSCTSSSGCGYSNTSFSGCSGTNTCQVSVTDGVGGIARVFTRKINITGSNPWTVSTTVSWENHGSSKAVKLNAVLYDIYKEYGS